MKDTIIRLRCAGGIIIGGPMAMLGWMVAFIGLLATGCGSALMARAAGNKEHRDPLEWLRAATFIR